MDCRLIHRRVSRQALAEQLTEMQLPIGPAAFRQNDYQTVAAAVSPRLTALRLKTALGALIVANSTRRVGDHPLHRRLRRRTTLPYFASASLFSWKVLVATSDTRRGCGCVGRVG